ncbi:hypothetical protein BGZ61DRAFT_76330 [Ilyonectria robusta]|uniref:uncharacterized protein n=1 Tax=Ilyonectria robusta TaxID=1079257 RepID=UPI001E8EA7E3|nr:uncharacterized protein BGZ61DRAFT_76330 [Ilyonectria robusta]KAH8677210.1 hypothetical protein BGZ61DRAFT_76330 [Ilyonectria robusta]
MPTCTHAYGGTERATGTRACSHSRDVQFAGGQQEGMLMSRLQPPRRAPHHIDEAVAIGHRYKLASLMLHIQEKRLHLHGLLALLKWVTRAAWRRGYAPWKYAVGTGGALLRVVQVCSHPCPTKIIPVESSQVIGAWTKVGDRSDAIRSVDCAEYWVPVSHSTLWWVGDKRK